MMALSKRAWRWLLLAYLAGIIGDFGVHIWHYATTGDRQVETFEWITGFEASLFWPVDLVAQLALALR
jgi:hypothetical protein